MKYCEEYAALLDPFVDGELPEEEMARVQTHLKNCPGCQAYVDGALTIRAEFPDVKDTIVPENFAAGVMERVRTGAGTETKSVELKKRWQVRRWAEALTALAACCALVILLRSGPGGWKQGDAAAPEGSEAAMAYDCPADAAESGSQTEEAAPQLAADTAGGEAKSRTADKNSDTGGNAESENGATPFAALPTAAAPEAMLDAAQEKPEEEPALCLSVEEEGGLLDKYTPAWESTEERGYELTAGEYQALLEALGRTEELTCEVDGPVLVVVTGPFG